MTRPTREDVNATREVGGLAGDMDIVDLCDAYLEQMTELEAAQEYREYWKGLYLNLLKRKEAMEAENQALTARYIQAVRDEPELDGNSPAELYEMIRNFGLEESFRATVRATKAGIIERIEKG